MESALVLSAVVLYVAGAFAWPTFRVWRRHGVWPIVFAREAAPAQRLLGWLTRALFVVVVGGALGRCVLAPEQLGLWSVPITVRAAGWLLLCCGAVLTVAAQRQMGESWRVGIDDRPTGLVTSGVFQLVRNPVFSGLLLFLAGYACLMLAWWSLALWAATAASLRVQIAWEERHLFALHGASYAVYATRVGRLVPWVGRLRSSTVVSEERRS